MYDIAIVGGGLGGLISSILLSKKGFEVLLVEKNEYPFHRVCGEYISNEVIPFLEANNLYPEELNPAPINRLMISSTSGNSFQTQLDLGGFGLSRYQYDWWLSRKAVSHGVTLIHDTILSLQKEADCWNLTGKKNKYLSQLVIGAHGKRTKLDNELNRDFMTNRSPYVGIKYHVKSTFAPDVIALHNFKAGYCGFSRIENNLYNLCYLVHRDQVRKYKNIGQLEKQVLHKNPHLKEIWTSSEFVFKEPKVINEISFHAKEPIYDGILMVGDAAGVITPLAGNGMAMAIRSAALASSIISIHYTNKLFNHSTILTNYKKEWNKQFQLQLWRGRLIQKTFFSHPLSSSLAVLSGKYLKHVTQSIIQQTHGEPFREILTK